MDDSIVDHVDATDLTTLGLFSVTHRRDGELDDGQNGYRLITGDLGRRLIRAAQDRGTRVELVYTSFGPGKNRQFYAEPEAQARWIEVLVDLVDELGLDGVNVDVERLPVEHVLDLRELRGPAARSPAGAAARRAGLGRDPGERAWGGRWQRPPPRTAPTGSSSWATTTTGRDRSRARRRRSTDSTGSRATSSGRSTCTRRWGCRSTGRSWDCRCTA